MSSLIELWWTNIKQNKKLISAFLTEIIITGIAMFVYGGKAGQGLGDILFNIWLASNTSLFIILRLIGKGEVAEVEDKLRQAQEDNNILKKEAHYNQIIAGYAIQLAAIKHQVPEAIIENENWIDANELLKEDKSTLAKTEVSWSSSNGTTTYTGDPDNNPSGS